MFILDTVILECEWVLRCAYGFAPDAICGAFTKLFGLPNIGVANPTFVAQAVRWHEQGLHFADALHLAQSQQYERFYTFDTKIVRKAEGLCKCTVSKP